MLYQRWRRICQTHPNQLALSELAGKRSWTFGQMASLAEQPLLPEQRFVFPSGNNADFVVQVLRGWRSGQTVCPLEPGQPEPKIRRLPGNIVHLKSTSASTAAPRLVAFTATQLIADAANIVETMGLRPDWPNIGLISLAHSYGFSNLVLPLLLHGIPLILAGSALPESVREACRDLHAVTIPGVPALWRTWLEAGAIQPNVRLAISAGAPLPVELEQEVFTRHAVKIHNFYGSSECGGIAFEASAAPRTDAACVGAPMRNVVVTVGKNGCVQVQSAAVGQTYWPEPSPKLQPGVFRTGDLGELKDGLLYLRGRATDEINVAGRKVWPETIEAVLSTHPEVRACLAFGVVGCDPQRGETIVACVAGAATVTLESLKRFAISRLPAWQVPREWWLVEALDANARGKLSRAEWRKRYLERCEIRRTEVRKGC